MATEKPLIVEVEEFKKELVDAFNELTKKHRIPAYFMEPIVGNIYNQVSALANQELNQAKEQSEQTGAVN